MFWKDGAYSSPIRAALLADAMTAITPPNPFFRIRRGTQIMGDMVIFAQVAKGVYVHIYYIHIKIHQDDM